MNNKPKAVVLLSGGLDSATVAAFAKNQGFDVYALSFSYGQRHKIELEFAKKQAEIQKLKEHKIINIDLRAFGGSALTDEIAVPKNRDNEIINKEIPITYVPARNTIFLSYALAYAEVLGANDIFIGVNALDYSGYPDCRPEYIKTFEKLANLATKAGVEQGLFRINTPLLNLTKADIIKLGYELGVDFENTISCYDPNPIDNKPCGFCDACILRNKGFREAGIS